MTNDERHQHEVDTDQEPWRWKDLPLALVGLVFAGFIALVAVAFVVSLVVEFIHNVSGKGGGY